MSSAFLDSLGLGYLDIGYILAGIAGMSLLLFLLTLILLIVQMKKLSRLNRRLQKFMGGKDAKSLEEEISDIFEDYFIIWNLRTRNVELLNMMRLSRWVES